jgi:hypothetical protein
MASLSYRRGAWELRYRDRQQRQRTERFPGPETRRAPEAALDRKVEVERDLRRGTLVAREQREATFGDYYARWVRARRISAARQHTDDSRAANHVLPYWEHWALCDIRPSDIDDWIGELAQKMGPDSVRHCYTLCADRSGGR